MTWERNPSFGVADEGVPIVSQIYEDEDGQMALRVFSKEDSLRWAADEIDRLTRERDEALAALERVKALCKPLVPSRYVWVPDVLTAIGGETRVASLNDLRDEGGETP